MLFRSGNRLVLGVGVGWMREEYELTGFDFATRGRRCDEMLDALRLMLAGGMVEYHGEFVDFPACEMVPVPERALPIWIAGHSDAAFRRAARFDGWLGSHYDVAELCAHARRFRALRASAAGRGAVEIVSGVNDLTRPDQVRELEDAGVTGAICMPLTWRGVAAATLEQ